MINSINSSLKGIQNDLKNFDNNSESILKDTTLDRNKSSDDFISHQVSRIELPHAVKLNIKALKTSDEMLGEIIDLKK